MDTGPIIAAVAVIISAAFAFLGVVYAQRAQNSAKLAENSQRHQKERADQDARLQREYLDDARFSSELAGALLDDYLGLSDCYGIVTEKWHLLISGFPSVCKADTDEVQAFMARVGDLPPRPEPRYRELQRHRREELRRAASPDG